MIYLKKYKHTSRMSGMSRHLAREAKNINGECPTCQTYHAGARTHESDPQDMRDFQDISYFMI